MKTKSAKVLPKTTTEITNGGLYRQSVRCGKSNCRCAAGALHEGYYYFIRRVDGRLRKTYVPKKQAKRLRSLIQQAKLKRHAERADRRSDRDLLSELRAQLREHDSIIRTLADALRHDG